MAEAIKPVCYQVTVASTGEQFVCPSDLSILSAAHAADVLISYSCRSGQCGSCLGRVLSGQVEYPQGLPDAISETEVGEGYALFCSAFARSDLDLEIIGPSFVRDPN